MGRRGRVLLVVGVVVAAFLAYEIATYFVAYTDDAYVRTDLVGVAGGGLSPRGSRQNTARRLGDLAPRASEIGQGSVEYPFEEASRSGVGHSRLGWP